MVQSCPAVLTAVEQAGGAAVHLLVANPGLAACNNPVQQPVSGLAA